MIDIKVNTDKLNRAMQRKINTLSDYEEPLRESGEWLLKDVDTNFRKQGALFGRGWKPLADSTRRQRARQGYPPARPILERTGRLRRGNKIKKVTKDTLTIGNDVDYFKYHQTGTRKMPQRKVLDIRSVAEIAIGRIFKDWLGRII